jgi:hypothetical protein
MVGVPAVLANSYDAGCDVYAIVLQLLGPSLAALRQLFPDCRLDDKMVLAVAIQLVSVCPLFSRY